MALTAALCFLNFMIGFVEFKFQMYNLLSLPPEANY